MIIVYEGILGYLVRFPVSFLIRLRYLAKYEVTGKVYREVPEEVARKVRYLKRDLKISPKYFSSDMNRCFELLIVFRF